MKRLRGGDVSDNDSDSDWRQSGRSASEEDDGYCDSDAVDAEGDVQRQRRPRVGAKPSEAAGKPVPKRQKQEQRRGRAGRTHRDQALKEGAAAAAAAAAFAEARLTDDLRGELGAVEKLSKRPWTKRKYHTQDLRFLWWCEHNDDGTKRTQAFDPSLASGDVVAKATTYMWWISKNCPGYRDNYANKPAAMGKSTAKQVHAALQLKFEQDHIAAGKELPVKNLLDYATYQAAQRAAHKAHITDKGERTDRDPQAGTMEDTVNPDQLIKVMIVMLGSSRRTACRDMSMALWSCQTIGRSDDARLLFLPDLLPPTLVRVIGPSPSFLVSAVLRGGKRQVGGKVAYAGCIRTMDALLCAQGALARNLVLDYTLDLRPWPSPTNREQWLKMSPIWIGGSGGESVSYSQQWEALKEYLAEAAINIKKRTHAWRFYKARDLDEQGVSDEVIARLGRWLRTALNTSYLRFFKPEGLLAAGGWDKDRPDAFFAERFCIDVPEELAGFVFPLLERLKKEVQELGEDELEDLPSAPAVVKNLQYLAVVVVQDACALLTSSDADIRKAAEANRVHKHLLTNQLFRDTLKAYQAKLEAGGYEMVRPLSTREHVQQLAASLVEVRAMLQERGPRVFEQMREQRPPCSIEDEEQQQKQQWDALLAKAMDAEGGSEPADTAQGAEAMDAEGGSEPAAGAGEEQPLQEDEQQQSLEAEVARLHAKVAALQAQLRRKSADPEGLGDADNDSTAGSPQQPPTRRGAAGTQAGAAAAAAAQPPSMLSLPFQSLLDSSGSAGPPQHQQRPAVPRRPAGGSDMLVGPYRSMMGKLHARAVPTASPGARAAKADSGGSAAAVAAAAAAQAVAATGADGAAVAAAAAQAAVQALAQAAAPAAAPAAAQPQQQPAGVESGEEAGAVVARAVPRAGSFKVYGDKQVQELWAWFTSPYNGWRSASMLAALCCLAVQQQQQLTRSASGCA